MTTNNHNYEQLGNKRLRMSVSSASISYGSDMLPSGDTAVAGVEVASSSTAATAVSVNGKNVDVGIALAKTAPRLYQAELLNKALEGNIIAVLDTGSGKTLIGVMLIKHMVANEIRRLAEDTTGTRRKRVSIFLVPLVPLVAQQEKYIRLNCDLVVHHYYGAMNVDQWKEDKWIEEIQKADVMVMTADIFRNMLEKAYITMAQVNLIIFDECHHARKLHPYNQIMCVHYTRTPEEYRPKIFGMTASPSSAKEDAKASIQHLETNLSCKAFTAGNSSLLAAFVHRPEEDVVYFEEGPFFDLPEIYIETYNAGGSESGLISKKMDDCLALCDELGPWCASKSLFYGIEETAFRLKRKTNNVPSERVAVDPIKAEAQAAHLLLFERIQAAIVNIPEQPLDKSTISPKVLALIKVLEEYRGASTDFCGIVFVERRSTARVLCDLVQRWPTLNFIRPGILIGHGVTSKYDQDTVMKVSEQKKTVAQFDMGRLNLLIATQVAEEGLDIRACMLVIRFNMFTTLTNYIQSRGRARHKQSKFVILAQTNDIKLQTLLAELRVQEQFMREVLQNDLSDDLADDDWNSLDRSPKSVYSIPSTGASVTLNSAVSLIHHYCSLLPKDAYCNYRPMFDVENTSEGGFYAKISMPINVPIECRFIVGPPSGTKTGAKRSAAFELVKLLHAHGELDDRLRPIRFVDFEEETEEIAEGRTPGLARVYTSADKKYVRQYQIKTPSCLDGKFVSGVPMTFYIVKMKFLSGETRYLNIGFLSAGEAPVRQMALNVSRDPNITCHVLAAPIRSMFADEELEVIKRFHFNLFSGLLRTPMPEQADWVLLAVPLKPNTWNEAVEPRNVIDWTTVRTGACETEANLVETLKSGQLGVIVVDSVQYARKYIVKRVLWDHTPFTDLPMANGKFQNVGLFYEMRLRYKEKIHPKQFVIEASTIPHISQNFEETLVTAETYLLPQFCTVFPLREHMLNGDGLHVPLVMRQLHHRLLVEEFRSGKAWLRETVQDTGYIPLAATTRDLEHALTAPAATLHYDYERLEILGDGFLKAHQSIHLFVKNPNRHEGWLSQARNLTEKNSALNARAAQIGLAGYILCDTLSRRSWLPPARGLATQKVALSDKTVADAVEAVIGANFLGGGVEGGAVAVKKLLGGDYETDWAEYRTQWDQIDRNAIKKEEESFMKLKNMEASVRKIEEKIAYKFKNPDLLIEALTHPSSVGVNSGACYQRLEFLGDAVLNFLVMRHIWHLEPPQSPGALTDLRSELVNNQFLATVAWTLNLTKHMDHSSPSLSAAIGAFGAQLEQWQQKFHWRPDLVGEMDVDPIEEPETPVVDSETTSNDDDEDSTKMDLNIPLFWNAVPTAPKAAGDIYEALIGAVLIDCGFDCEPVWEVIGRTLIIPWWSRFELAMSSNGGVVALHPTREIVVLANNIGCSKITINCKGIEESGEYACVILLHNTTMGSATGVNKREARRAAAMEAVRAMKADTASFQKLCTCAEDKATSIANALAEAAAGPVVQVDPSFFGDMLDEDEETDISEAVTFLTGDNCGNPHPSPMEIEIENGPLIDGKQNGETGIEGWNGRGGVCTY